ncbi:alpha/beta fold hydrolase [Solicola sp. PLA-1-18]|uniref:alpha/beta fold hydrolase n=1 Tax=Solicola sp. PLA-1-18 TaxID=3380532 RepID=UPI003B79B2DB
MSTPRTLDLPGGVHLVTISTPRGELAGQEAVPEGDVRGHVLLVPGFTGSKEDFTPVLPLLAAAGWHATAYDQRGQWESPGSDDADYDLEGFAADALAVRTVASRDRPTSHLVGHSFGGLVAQAAVVADPSVWSGLTLLCSGPGAFTGADKLDPLASFVRAVPELGLERLFEVRQAAAAPVTDEIRAFLRARFTGNDPRSLATIAEHLRSAPDRVADVAATGVPVHVVRGADDDAWPHDVQADMASRYGTSVQVVPGSAHSPAVENPPAAAQALLDTF